jgi:poly(3-hydroxybutyrate) depolymerase
LGLFGGSLVTGGARNRVTVANSAGGTRHFYLAVPAGADAPGAVPRPLLLALHGGAAYGDRFLIGAPLPRRAPLPRTHPSRGPLRARCLTAAGTSLDAKGVAAGYVVAAPDGLPGLAGLGGTWGIHNDIGDGAGDVRPWVDDIAFLGDVAACIASLGVPLDGTAVLAGYSLGAKFASRVACTPPPGLRVVAAALAAGVQAEASRGACAGGAVPTILFQGAADAQVPLCVRALGLGAFSYAPTMPHFAALVRRNGGDPSAYDALASPLGDTAVYRFAGAGAPTALYWLPTGGHVWPGRISGCAGDASDVALAFFDSARAAGPAAAATVPPRLCAGLAPAQRQLPCGAPPQDGGGGSFR